VPFPIIVHFGGIFVFRAASPDRIAEELAATTEGTYSIIALSDLDGDGAKEVIASFGPSCGPDVGGVEVFRLESASE